MKKLFLIILAFFFFHTDIYAYKLTPYLPQKNPTGIGIIVCPGGSYFWLDKKNEGEEVAKWLRDHGFAAFVLEYSHGGWASFAFHLRLKGRSYPAGFKDLCQALDSIRAHADEYGIRKDRIGCMGFSAGGHLVINVAEQLAGRSSGMQFVAALYPVVSMNHRCTHKRSRRGLLGEFPSHAMRDSLSLEHHVPKNCPPVFLMNCNDDPVVHYHNAELLDSALTAQRIPHHYEHYQWGGHGFGISEQKTTTEAIQWKTRFLEWLQKLFK